MIVPISSRLRVGSFRKLPNRESAYQGGISRAVTLLLIAWAQGRTSSYERSDIGATCFGRWQLAHFVKTIGATSLLKVGAPLPARWAAPTPAKATDRARPTRTNLVRGGCPTVFNS